MAIACYAQYPSKGRNGTGLGNLLAYVVGATGAVTYAVTAGALPPGTTLHASTGIIDGTPTVNGSYAWTVTATDSLGSSSATFATEIDTAAVLITGNPGTLVLEGVTYTTQFFESLGTSPFTWSITGTPPGLTFTPSTNSALLGGRLSAVGVYPIAVTVTDTNGFTCTFNYTLVVLVNPVSVTGVAAPGGWVGSPYSGGLFQGVGGTPPYTYAIASGGGRLPVGVSLNASSGLLSGNPLTAATYAGIQVQATDHTGDSNVSNPFSIVIGVRLTPSFGITGTVGNGQENVGYSAPWTIVGGAGAPYTVTVFQGPLPAGLTVSQTGIAGTPSPGSAGTYSNLQFEIVDNAGHAWYSSLYAITIIPGAAAKKKKGGQTFLGRL
jgi:hypothetical protein